MRMNDETMKTYDNAITKQILDNKETYRQKIREDKTLEDWADEIETDEDLVKTIKDLIWDADGDDKEFDDTFIGEEFGWLFSYEYYVNEKEEDYYDCVPSDCPACYRW